MLTLLVITLSSLIAFVIARYVSNVVRENDELNHAHRFIIRDTRDMRD